MVARSAVVQGVPGKGKILTQLSLFWFELLKDVIGHHVITADINQMPAIVQSYRDQLEGRVMLVKRLAILPIEAIVRGYISGALPLPTSEAGARPRAALTLAWGGGRRIRVGMARVQEERHHLLDPAAGRPPGERKAPPDHVHAEHQGRCRSARSVWELDPSCAPPAEAAETDTDTLGCAACGRRKHPPRSRCARAHSRGRDTCPETDSLVAFKGIVGGTAAEIIGKANADRVAAASIALYEKVRTATGMARDARSHAGLTCERVGNVRTQARDFALTKGIIIADTKFEFGLNEAGEVILADEVLTPGTATRPCDKGLCPCANWCFYAPAHTCAHAADSSRFWPADSYKIGASQNRYEGDRRRAGRPLRLKADGWRRAPPSSSFDKQYVRDYLLSINFDKKHGVALPDDVIANTLQKYRDVYRILTGKDAIL